MADPLGLADASARPRGAGSGPCETRSSGRIHAVRAGGASGSAVARASSCGRRRGIHVATVRRGPLVNKGQDVAIVGVDVGRAEVTHRLRTREHPAAEPVGDQQEIAPRIMKPPAHARPEIPPPMIMALQDRHRRECSLGDSSFSQSLGLPVIPRPGSGPTRGRKQPPESRDAVRALMSSTPVKRRLRPVHLPLVLDPAKHHQG